LIGRAEAQSTTTMAPIDTTKGVGLLARIIFAEGAQDFRVPNALEGIGSVILNRADSQGVGMPSTIDAVILQPGAFDGVNNSLFALAQNPNSLNGINVQAFTRSLAVAQGLINGSIKDPTGRALFFFSGQLSQPPNGEFRRNIASGRLIHTTSFGNTHFFKDRDARF
jgi:spore germination cell wall hydrolase CwlJ-like protein